jgi:hypothetical protein
MHFQPKHLFMIGAMSALLNSGMAAAWWEGAPAYPIQYSFGASPAKAKTDVRMIADGDMLRIRFVCSEPRALDLRAGPFSRLPVPV